MDVEETQVPDVAGGVDTVLPQHLPMFMPIVRFDEANWTVTGQATVEAEDAYGTIFDYEASKRAFQAWRGNVREMHDSKKAVGRSIDVTYDDAAKAIFVTTRVSRGAKDTWEKIKDGTLTGYSVGALADKNDWTNMERNGKPTPVLTNYKLVELSLVDHPATPGCDVQIVRADGFANGEVLMSDEALVEAEAEVELESLKRVADAAGERELTAHMATATDTRAGATISHITSGQLHSARDASLSSARGLMSTCGCEDCNTLAKHHDAASDENYSREMASYRELEPVIQRLLSPTLQRVNAMIAQSIQRNTVSSPAPVKVDLTTIERRLDVIEQGVKAVTDLEALTRVLDTKLVEIRELAERIANQPTTGGPFVNGHAMDKVLATGAGAGNSVASELAVLQRMAQNSNLSQDEQVRIATQQIKLERGY